MDQSKLGKDKKLTDKPESVFPTARLISHESDNSSGRIPKLRICLRPNSQEASLSSPSSQDDDANKITSINRNSCKKHKGANSLIDESSIDSNSYDSEGAKNAFVNSGDEKRHSLPLFNSQQCKDPSFTPNITMTRRKSALAKLHSNEELNEISQSTNLTNRPIKIEKTFYQDESTACGNETELSSKMNNVPNSSEGTVTVLKNQTKSQFKRCTRRTSLQEKNGSLVDLINPDSLLTKVNFKALINKTTFESLPASLQFQLIKYLPNCDKAEDEHGVPRAHQAAFQNEFLAKALSDFPNRIRSGEFIKVNDTISDPEVDKWKIDYFEEYWGQSTAGSNASNDVNYDTFASHNNFKTAKMKSTSSPCRKRLLPTCPKMVTRKSKLSLNHRNQPSMCDDLSMSELATSVDMKQETLETGHSRVPLAHTDSLFTPNFREERVHSLTSSLKAGTPMTLRRQRVPTRRWRQHQEDRRRIRDIQRPKNNSISEPSGQQMRLETARSSSLTSPSGSSGEAESALSGFSKPSPPTSKPQISNMITTSPLSVSRSPRSPMPPPTEQLTCRTGSDLVPRSSSGPSSNVGAAGNEPLISPMAPPRKTKTLAAMKEKMRALRQMKEQRATPLTQHGCNSDMGLLTSPLSPSTLLSTFEDDSLDRMSASISSLGHCDSNNSIPAHDSIDSCQPFNLSDIQFDQHLLDTNLQDDNLTSEKQLNVDLFSEIDDNVSYSPTISSKLSNIQTSSSASQKPMDSILPNLSTSALSQIPLNHSDSPNASTSSDDKQKNNLPQQQFVLIPNPKNSSLILCRATPIYGPGVSPETGEAQSFIIHTANGPVALINTQNSNQLSHASLLSAIAKSLGSKEETTPAAIDDVDLNSAPTSSNSPNVTAARAPSTIDESVSKKLIEAVRNKIAMTANNQNKSSISTSSSTVVTSGISKPQTSSIIQSVNTSQSILTLSQCQQITPIHSQTTLHTAKCVTPSANSPNLSTTVHPQNQPVIPQITTPQVSSSAIIRNGYAVNSTHSPVMLRALQPSFNLQLPHTSVQIQERPIMTANIIRPRSFSPFVSTVQGPTSSYGVQSPQMLHQILQSSDSTIRPGIPPQYIMSTFQPSSVNQLSSVASPFVGKTPIDQGSMPLQLLFNTNQISSPVIVSSMPGNAPLHLPVSMSPGLQPQYVSNIKTSTLQPVVANVSGSLRPAYRPPVNQKGISEYKSIKRKNKPISKVPAKRRKSFNTNDITDSVSNQSIAVESTHSEPVISDAKKESDSLINVLNEKSLKENELMEVVNSDDHLVQKTTVSLEELDTNIQLHISEPEILKECAENPTVDSEEKVNDQEIDSSEVSMANLVPIITQSVDLGESCSMVIEENIQKDDAQGFTNADEVVQSGEDDLKSTYNDDFIEPTNGDENVIMHTQTTCDPLNPPEIDEARETEYVEICADKSLIENTNDSDSEDNSKSSEIEPNSNNMHSTLLLTESPIKESDSIIKLPDEITDAENEAIVCKSDCGISNNPSHKLKDVSSPENVKDNAYDSDDALDLSMPFKVDTPNDSPLDLTTQDKTSSTTCSTEKKTSDSINEPKSHLVADILNQHSTLSSDSQSGGGAVSNSHVISILSSSNSSV